MITRKSQIEIDIEWLEDRIVNLERKLENFKFSNWGLQLFWLMLGLSILLFTFTLI